MHFCHYALLTMGEHYWFWYLGNIILITLWNIYEYHANNFQLLYQFRILQWISLKFREVAIWISPCHDASGHPSDRKVRALLHARFTWPFIEEKKKIIVEVVIPAIETEESMQCWEASNILAFQMFSSTFCGLGLFPKGKGSARDLLTAIYMACRWADIKALKYITA